ncbi:cysteine synthase A [Lachnotalea sp. AF33-28]|uniref:cysteine synthase A n=1 Tax=Lachnotalea sp. AF33-28 TaxID=2292046 RepID=UPI000E50C4F1|nr:cysteine synthase A [Lachnotalea sp. AF33-28]RHP35403.1 cysteine synthase A [Lachnotalea sp. AF33-28]
MGKIYQDITELIGHTPLMELSRLAEAQGAGAKILGKLESFNPAGSVKDRVAKKMIEDAEASGKLAPGSVIIEPTSGNTGIGLAAVGTARGYRVIIVMPDTMSAERRSLMKAYGAEVVLSEGSKGMTGALETAAQLAEETKGAVIMGQFVNPSNPAAHYCTTGPELWEDTGGRIDILVAGIGTGGTITGTGEYLKSRNPAVCVVGVEPAGSPLLTAGKAGAHKIQGIGANFVPEIFNREICDQILTVKDEDAMDTCRKIASAEGFLAGISAGAAVWAALYLSKLPENAGKTIAVILPDTGEHYLSMDLF